VPKGVEVRVLSQASKRIFNFLRILFGVWKSMGLEKRRAGSPSWGRAKNQQIFMRDRFSIQPLKQYDIIVRKQAKNYYEVSNMEEKKKVGAGFGILILQNSKILLGHRHEDPEKASSLLNGAGTWTMPGGKLEFGESFEEGAKREALEETGLKLNRVNVICVSNDMVETAHFVTIGLFCDDFEGEPKVMEPDEITEWRWFDLNNLPSPIYFPSARVLENYKNKSFYTSILS